MSEKIKIEKMKKFCVICKQTYGKYMRECCTKNSLVCINFHGFIKRKIKYFSLSGRELNENDLLEIFKQEELIYKKLIDIRKKRLLKINDSNNKNIDELSKLKSKHFDIFELIKNVNNVSIINTKTIDQFINATNQISKNEYPFVWASLQSTLGSLLAQKKHGNRVNNQEEAIAAYNRALEIRNYNVTPYEWASTMNNLSIVYCERIIGNRIENIEKSIDCCRKALRVFKRDTFPQDWSQVMCNLGNAYYSRIKGKRKKNIEESIDAYNKALEEVTKHSLPLVWSKINHNLGLTFYSLQDIEKSLMFYDRALVVRTLDKYPILWVETMHCRALAYLKPTNNQNVERAIDILKQVLNKKSISYEWCEVKYTLALAFLTKLSKKTDDITKKNLHKLENELTKIERDDGNTLLMYAANHGFSTIVNMIINSNQDIVNITNNEYSTALICACQSGQFECVEKLLKANAEPNVQNKLGLTPLIAAIIVNNIEIVKLLINFGSDLNQSYFEFTPLNLSIFQDNAEIANFLINSGCNINNIPEKGTSPLFLAISNKNTALSLVLIDKGADLNVQNSKGNTPLMEAIYLNNLDIIYKLVNCGADLNIRDNIGYTALMIATDLNNTDVVKHLVKNDVDINITDRLGNTALIVASKKGHINCAKLLIEYNAKIDIENDAGDSANKILLRNSQINLNELSKYENIVPQKKDKYDKNDSSNKRLINRKQVARHLRVFISSTFIDMEEERNILVKNILSQLNEICEKKIISLSYVDLRWGITEEQSKNEKILSICLDEIEKCNVFIGILGDRYGWIPESIPNELLMREEWLKYHKEESITEIEFWKGAFNTNEKAVFFYLRDSSYSNNKNNSKFKEIPSNIEIERFGKNEANLLAQIKYDKLIKLKKRITEGPFINKNYTTPKQFSNMVLKDLKKLINDKYPIEFSTNFIEREKLIHANYAYSLTESYIVRDDYSRQISRCNEANSPLVISGEYGSGKSALIANWLYNNKGNLTNYDLCIPYFVKANNISNEIDVLLKRIINELNNFFLLQLDLTNINNRNYSEIFVDTIHYVSQQENSVIIIIDDIDRITHNYEKFDLSWIPLEIPKNIQFIVTTSCIEQAEKLQSRSWDILELKPLSIDEKLAYIKKYFKQFGKTLSDNLIEQLATSIISNKVLNLQIILFELNICSDNETLQHKVNELCSLKNTSEILNKIFSRYELDYNFDVKKVMKYIATSRFGLDELELRTLAGSNGDPLPQIYWLPFFNVSKFLFSNTSGLIINFSNDYFRKYIETRYMLSDNEKIYSHTILANYFQNSNNPSRKIIEFPWQLLKSCSWSKLYELLSDISFFIKLLSTRYFDSFMYWYYLEKNGYSPSTAYQKVFDNPNILSHEYLWVFANFFTESGLSNKIEPMMNIILKELRAKKNWKLLQPYLSLMTNILSLKGELQKALNIIEEQIRICNQHDNMEFHLGKAFLQKATILYKYGKINETLLLYKKASKIFKKLNKQKEYLECEYYINTLTKDNKNIYNFINKFEDKLKDANNSYDLLNILCIKAQTLQDIGDYDQSISIARESVKKAKELGLLTIVQDLLLILSLGIKNRAIQREKSNYYQNNENTFIMDLKESLKKSKEQEELSKKIGDIDNFNNAIGNQGIIYRHLKEYQKALDCLLLQEKTCRKYGYILSLERCLLNKANLYTDLNDYEQAKKNYEEGEKICRTLNLPHILFSNLFNQVVFYSSECQNYPFASKILKKTFGIEPFEISLENQFELDNFTFASKIAEEAYEIVLENHFELVSSYSEHVNFLKNVLSTNANSIVYLYNKGVTNLKHKKYDTALEFFNNILDKHPNMLDALFNRGVVWINKENYSNALSDYNKIIAIDPNNSRAYYNRGTIWHNKEEYEKAIMDFNKAINLDELYVKAYNDRGLVWYDMGEYTNAQNDFNKAIQIDPKYAASYNNRGRIFLIQKNYLKAVEDFNSSLIHDSMHFIAYYNRGISYYYIAKFNNAIDDFTKYLNQFPNHTEALRFRSLSYLSSGNYRLGISDLNAYLNIFPNDDQSLSDRGLAYFHLNETDNGINDIKKAIYLAPNEAEHYFRIGLCYSKIGQFEEAINHVKKAVQLNSKNEIYQTMLMELLK